MTTRKPMKSRSLCRLSKGTGVERWVHVSLRGLTCKLRWFAPGYKEETFATDSDQFQDLIKNGETFSLEQVSTLLAEVISQPLSGLPVSQKADWKHAIELLALRDPVELSSKKALSPSTRSPSLRAPKLIPKTRLRRFYETLRGFPTDAMHKAFCDHLLGAGDRTDLLQEIFAESARHFGQYQNADEKFHSRDNDASWNAEYRESTKDFAKCLVARVNPNSHGSECDERAVTGSTRGFRVVDYEVSPLRTTAAVFEDGASGRSSGSGGVDLLLCDELDRVPIIGEVKAKTDTNMFLALVQALNYAVELTTTSQLERLTKAYPAHFDERTSANRKCDIFLIYEQQTAKPKLLDETRAIAKKLLGDQKLPIAKCVRRIRFFACRLARTGIELEEIDRP